MNKKKKRKKKKKELKKKEKKKKFPQPLCKGFWTLLLDNELSAYFLGVVPQKNEFYFIL